MDGRISAAWLLSVPLTVLCAGCITTQPQKSATTPPTTNTNTNPTPTPTTTTDPGRMEAKKNDGPKRNPKPATEIEYGKMTEMEADSDAAKANPEAQARLRDDARRAYQHALKLDPNNLEAHRRLGRLYAKMGDYPRAYEIYSKAMAKQPNDPTLWYEVGLCHNRRRDFNESLRCFTKAHELDPENRDYLKMLGFTLAWTGKTDQGLAYLTRAQGAAQAHVEIGCMYDQKEQRDLAIHHLRLALRENPHLQTARDLLTALENSRPQRTARGG